MAKKQTNTSKMLMTTGQMNAMMKGQVASGKPAKKKNK
jgi:hypothetical protein